MMDQKEAAADEGVKAHDSVVADENEICPLSVNEDRRPTRKRFGFRLYVLPARRQFNLPALA
jgi:hypothetical protein